MNDKLVDRIYDTLTEPGLWSSVLDEMSNKVAAVGGGLLTRRNDAWTGYVASKNLAMNGFSLTSAAAVRSQTTGRLLAFNRNGFVTDEELFTEEDYRADSLISDFALPNQLYHAAATAINVPSGDLVVVQLTRRLGQAGFNSRDLRLLDEIRPHVARAAMLATRWRLERLRSAVEAMATVGLPAAILDSHGRVIVANTLIEELQAHIVWGAADVISFTDRAAAAKLKNELMAARLTETSPMSTFPAMVNGTDRVIAHLLPVRPNSRDLFEGGVSLLVVTPIAAQIPATSLIQGLFDLTPAEAFVAQAVGEGLSRSKIARRRGVSVETINTQVSAIFAKTGAKRQVELAALLGALPKFAGVKEAEPTLLAASKRRT